MAEVTIKQVRSANRANRPQLRGMLRVVDHLVEVAGPEGDAA